MKIEEFKAIILNYVVRDETGDIIDSSDNDGPISYIHGTEDLIPGLESALEGREEGDKLTVDVPKAQAYGEHDENLVDSVPLANFEGVSDIQPGMSFQTEMDDGSPMVVHVTAVENGIVTVDGNHPLAGKDLQFEVEIVTVRDASSEELEHGHVHAPGESCYLH